MSANEKSLGQICAEGAGWTWENISASQRAEWQRGAEIVQVEVLRRERERKTRFGLHDEAF